MTRTSFYFCFAMMWLLVTTVANAGHGQELGTARGNSQSSCRQIAVFGAVRNPRRVSAEPGMRLLEVLARVGGPTGAAGNVVRLVQTCKCSPCSEAEGKAGEAHEYNLIDVLRGLESGNPSVAPGDIVIVHEAGSVFVIGNVVGGRTVRFSEWMTVMRAIKMAGIAVGYSELVTVRIYRRSSEGTGQGPIIVRLKAVLDGRAENVLLQPWDVVEVSDPLGHFPSQKLSPPTWDPLLLPRKDNSGL